MEIVKCGMQILEFEAWSAQWRVQSVECRVESVKREECEAWRVECGEREAWRV